MKIKFDRSFYIPKNASEIKDPQSTAVAYLIISETPWRTIAVGFSGKRAKPDFNYSYRDESQARAKIAAHAEGVRTAENFRATRRAQRQAEKCHTPLDVWNKARGNGYLSAAETAICLRAALTRAFPGVKFSVTSDNYSMGCSVRVAWTDGPAIKTVDAIAQNYSFAGFDGMIDMKYSKDRWLARDGSMSLAHSTGTDGSRGSVGESLGSPHSADCVLVQGGADYVSTSRSRSFAAELSEARALAEKYRVTLPDFPDHRALQNWTSRTVVNFGSCHEYFSTLMWQEQTRAD